MVMARRGVWLVGALAALAHLGCGGGSSGGGGITTGTTTPGTTSANVAVAAGLETLEPATSDTVSANVDLARLGITQVDAVYELTTPASQAFALNVFAREEGNSGNVRLSLGHVADGGTTPQGGPGTVAEAGIVPGSTSTTPRNEWLDLRGDGFARLALAGEITREQVLAVQAETQAGVETILLRFAIGAASEINTKTQPDPSSNLVLSEETIFSSDSWSFGLPTVAISGDRTTVVCYDGDRNDPFGGSRYEMRLQHDRQTGQVTGGGSPESNPDSGNWRDHEIAALFNVLAVVSGGADQLNLRLSFDRGATFPQSVDLVTGLQFRPRLVQIAMAADYTLAVTYWRTNSDLSADLVLFEGSPSAFDVNNSPTAFSFGAPQVVRHENGDVTPLIMGVEYSIGGDLVVGYGSTVRLPSPAGVMRGLTQYRCATRMFGSANFNDVLVEEVFVESMDPSVSLLGQGSTMNIAYAYEAADGVRFALSTDGGQTFSTPRQVAGASAHLPSVFLREQGGNNRLDILFLETRAMGNELKVRHWDNYDGVSPGEVRTLAASSSGTGSGGVGLRITTVNWLGYDATLDGDDVVVALDEHTYDAIFVCGGPVGGPLPVLLGGASAAFVPAAPPPLAPGLTQPVPAPDSAHAHQLKLLRID